MGKSLFIFVSVTKYHGHIYTALIQRACYWLLLCDVLCWLVLLRAVMRFKIVCRGSGSRISTR